MVDWKDVSLKSGAVLAAVLVGFAGGHYLFPQVKEVPGPTVTVEKTVTVEVPGPTVTVPGPVQVKEVAVDNGNLDMVLEHIYDHDGNVEYLTDDLKDSEVHQIVNRIVFLNDAESMAINYVQDEALKQLDEEVVNGTELDRHDIERLKVYTENGDVTFSAMDMDDKEVDVTIKTRFYQDDVKYTAYFTVSIVDGEVSDIDLQSVEEAE